MVPQRRVLYLILLKSVTCKLLKACGEGLSCAVVSWRKCSGLLKPTVVFERCVAQCSGNRKVQRFTCMDQCLCMAFAQLTFCESLRDIEACLRSQTEKLYHMGIRGQVSRNMLANANATRDWRIYADFAQRLISIARKLYINEPFGIDLANIAYALDSTTIDLSLSLFAWAPFRTTKAAVKMHTLLDLRGHIPSFIHISDGKLHDVKHPRSTDSGS